MNVLEFSKKNMSLKKYVGDDTLISAFDFIPTRSKIFYINRPIETINFLHQSNQLFLYRIVQ